MKARQMVCVSLLALMLTPAAAEAVPVGPGSQPVLVVPCRFSNQPPPGGQYTRAYYQRMFSDAGQGQLGMLDYFRDVSFGQMSVSGTLVTDWVVAKTLDNEPLTRDAWRALSRPDKVIACANGVGNADLSRYRSVVALVPESVAALSSTVTAQATTLTLTPGEFWPSSFPTPPYNAVIHGAGGLDEQIRVTAVSGNTLTVVRGQGGTVPLVHAGGELLDSSGDMFGLRRTFRTVRIDTTVLGVPESTTWSYFLGVTLLPHQAGMSVAAHEVAHGLGWDFHSHKLSTSTLDYKDSGDIMSAMDSIWTFTGVGAPFGTGSLFGNIAGGPAPKGPGMNAITLDRARFIPATKVYPFNNAIINQVLLNLRSLSDSNALSGGFLEARIPAVVSIPVAGGGTTTSDYMTVEYRSRSGWDRGFPANGVMLHLHGANGGSYWIDQTPLASGGLLRLGEQYVDAARRIYIAVNSAGATGSVTLASHPITARRVVTAPRVGERGTAVSPRVVVTTTQNAPVPNAPVEVTIGSQRCQTVTDAAGVGRCPITLTQPVGSYLLRISVPLAGAYARPADYLDSFQIKDGTTLRYAGPSTVRYLDTVRMVAQLLRRNDGGGIGGQPVTFTMRNGQSCSATTGGFGTAECFMQVTAPPNTGAETTPVTVSFPGTSTYMPAEVTAGVRIVPRTAVLDYTGPKEAINGTPLTLTATLTEPSGFPVVDREVAFQLGSGFRIQSCAGRTTKLGQVSCVIPSVFQPLGEAPLAIRFDGDGTYASTSLSRSVEIFAPSE